jgi:hypothetical protein
MKKFYESPVVEITVFDVEDVITTSVKNIDTTDGNVTQYIKDVKNNYAGTADAKVVSDFGSYTW